MFTQLTDNTYTAAFAETAAGVCICYKKLCPHCKNMEKVLEKFHNMEPDAQLFSLDLEEQATAAKALGAERAPTLLRIANGKVVASKGGLMNPKEMLAWYADNN